MHARTPKRLLVQIDMVLDRSAAAGNLQNAPALGRVAWSESRKLGDLGESGIAKLLRNFVFLGRLKTPRAKERNSGCIMA